jgi:hypothetical protein
VGQEGTQRMRGRTKLIVFAVCGVVVCMGACGWVALKAASYPFLQEGKGTIDDPSVCHTSLAKTTACRGSDTSWQECHYQFRADGIPDADVCASFLAAPIDASASTTAGQPCPEMSPAGWRRIACERFRLDATMACFYCVDGRLESARQVVQAFAPSCERGVVLKSCNQELP